MPELPDLEVQASNLNRLLHGKRVTGVTVARSKRVHPSAGEMEKVLKGATIKKIRREGKELRIDFSNGHSLGIHLMLHGALIPASKGEAVKSVTMSIALDGGHVLAITDRQAWITVTLDPAPSSVPDALSEEFTWTYFHARAKDKPSALIKMFLIGQDVIQGLGNAYSDEILWYAKVDPESRVKALPLDVLRKIHSEIRAVLKKAIKDIEKSHPDMTSGEPRDHLAVHDPEKSHSPTGYEIKKKDVKGKTTYYTDEQKLYK